MEWYIWGPPQISMPTSSYLKSDILVVDDNSDNLRLLCGMLKERGFSVRPAPSGKHAVDAAESRPPDLILLDINMPVMDGYETCRELKKREGLDAIPVIFVSALGETIDKVHAFEAGGVDYVTKPVKIEEIEARIKTHVTLKRLRASLEQKVQELHELEQHRDQLTHMIAHDLRSPLGVIIGSLDLIRQCYSEDVGEIVMNLIQSSFASAEVINGMISDMLDVSRMESDQMPLSPAAVGVEEIVNVGERVALNGRLLEMDLEPGMEGLYCDGELVRRVLSNLLNNAVKFSPIEGVIRLGVHSTPGGQVRFEVQDQGPGIPAEYHEKIFEKFGQVEGEQKPRVASTGLGLTFCRLAVEAHGGAIGVESQPGQGSLFWFTIPRAMEQKLAA